MTAGPDIAAAIGRPVEALDEPELLELVKTTDTVHITVSDRMRGAPTATTAPHVLTRLREQAPKAVAQTKAVPPEERVAGVPGSTELAEAVRSAVTPPFSRVGAVRSAVTPPFSRAMFEVPAALRSIHRFAAYARELAAATRARRRHEGRVHARPQRPVTRARERRDGGGRRASPSRSSSGDSAGQSDSDGPGPASGGPLAVLWRTSHPP